MNRREFIASGAISAAMLSVFPSFALTNSTSTSLSNLGKGFEILSSKAKSVSILNLSSEVKTTYESLTSTLDKLGYIYDKNSINALNKSSYLIPLSKQSFLGAETKEIALIIKGNKGSDFYILNEKLSSEFNLLIKNFHDNMKGHEMEINTSDFAFPVEVVKQKTGVESKFVYKNKFNNVITLHNYKSVSKSIIS